MNCVSRPGNSRGCLPLKARFIWFGFTRFLTVGMLQNTKAGKFEGEEIVDNDSLTCVWIPTTLKQYFVQVLSEFVAAS